MSISIHCRRTALVLALSLAGSPAWSAESRPAAQVAADIDRLIAERLSKAGIPASPAADDAEFLRRAYLDIVGHIPTAAQAQAFLDSRDADKRRRLIDELLAHADHGRHFGEIWRDLIVHFGVPGLRINSAPLQEWLAKSFNDNRGWDRVVADLLTASGQTNQPELIFIRVNTPFKEPPKPNLLAGSVSQLFMGIQLQCAECHQHPFQSWEQKDFWGLAAFFGRLQGGGRGIVEGPPRGKAPDLGPNIKIPDDAFRNPNLLVRARFPGGPEPTLDAKAGFRPALADWLTAKDNPYFAANAVNRLWAHFLGRGFVNPLHDFHADNPPSHPELLQLLAREFASSGFDQKHLIRCICLSQTYQRTSRPLPENKNDQELFSRMAVKLPRAEVLYRSLGLALDSPNNVGTRDTLFLDLFRTRQADEPATDYSNGIPQALHFLNQLPLETRNGRVDRLIQEEKGDADRIVDQLYLATLSRRPSASERQQLADHLAKQTNRRDGYVNLFWTLLNRSEFLLIR